MKCHYHPDRESIAKCAICGKPVCKECGMEIGGNIICKDCVSDLVSASLAEKVSKKVSSTDIKKDKSEKEKSVNLEPNRAEPKTQAEPIQENNTKQNIGQKSDITLEPTTLESKVTTNKEKGNIQKLKDIQKAQIKKEDFPQKTPNKEVDNYYNSELNYDPELAKKLKNNNEDFIVPIHTPEELKRQEELENKYEKYLDDLYYDEPEKHEMSLKEQLAIDEEENGLLINEKTSKTKQSQKHKQWIAKKDKKENRPKQKKELNHNIHKKQTKEKEPFSAVDILLTIILIILILIVLFYILYLFALSTNYPTFIDALFGLLTSPGKFIGNIFG